MFRGNAAAKVDQKGRLKLPSRFRSVIPESYGRRFFITSLRGDCAWIYPLETWRGVEKKIAAAPSINPSIQKFKRNVNFFGHEAEIDGADRILLPSVLRERADVNGDVFVMGADDHLEVWNRDKFDAAMQDRPIDDADLNTLASFNI
jgi:transcriptional regulator MraZ